MNHRKTVRPASARPPTAEERGHPLSLDLLQEIALARPGPGGYDDDCPACRMARQLVDDAPAGVTPGRPRRRWN